MHVGRRACVHLCVVFTGAERLHSVDRLYFGDFHMDLANTVHV